MKIRFTSLLLFLGSATVPFSPQCSLPIKSESRPMAEHHTHSPSKLRCKIARHTLKIAVASSYFLSFILPVEFVVQDSSSNVKVAGCYVSCSKGIAHSQILNPWFKQCVGQILVLSIIFLVPFY